MMIFEQNKSFELWGKKTGYVASYFLFTTILFFILILTDKMPSNWSYFHVAGITLLITLAGITIKRLLR